MKFEIGDKVKVIHGLEVDETIEGWNCPWVPGMDVTVGKEYQIAYFCEGSGYQLAGSNDDDHRCDYFYPESVLELVKSAPIVSVGSKNVNPVNAEFIVEHGVELPSGIDNFFFDAEINFQREGDGYRFDIYAPDGQKMTLNFAITGRGHGKNMVSRFVESVYKVRK